MRDIFLFEFQNSVKIGTEEKEAIDAQLQRVWDNWQKIKDLWIEDPEEEAQEDIEFSEELDPIKKQSKPPFVKYEGNWIKSKNYIGYIRCNGVNITLLPKLFWSTPEMANDLNIERTCGEEISNEHKKALTRIFNHILYYFSYCQRLKFPFSETAQQQVEFDNFLDLVIYIFASETLKVVSAQPYQQYTELTEETSFLKGRLNINEYISNSLVSGDFHKLHCTYEPFVYDNLLNRIIKYTTNLLLNQTKNSINTNLLSEILFILDEVSSERVVYADCNKARKELNQFFDEYQSVLNMCQMFLANEMISLNSDSIDNFCFLLPMEYVFEDFIYGFLEKEMQATPKREQSNLACTTKVEKDHVFRIKPDISLKSKEMIIDTKYKIRKPSSKVSDRSKKGISQFDMYQMTAYALKAQCRRVRLLYPSMSSGDGAVVLHDDYLVASKWLNKVQSEDYIEKLITLIKKYQPNASFSMKEGRLMAFDENTKELDVQLYEDIMGAINISAADIIIKATDKAISYQSIREDLDNKLKLQLFRIINYKVFSDI